MGGLAVPAMAWCMAHWGWRNTSIGSGLLVLCVGLPLARIIRRRPEDHGEHVDGLDPARQHAHNEAGYSASEPQTEFTASQALRTRAFWLLAMGHGLALLVVSAVNVHAITHMKEGLGYSVSTASWVVLVMTCFQVGGVLTGAAMGDRFEKRHVAALCMLAHALGLLCLTFGISMPMLMGFAVLHGIAWGLRGPFMQAIRADYFGRNAIGMILGLSAAIIALGQIGGPMIAGMMADLTGNYQLGFIVLAILSALGSFTFIWATKPIR
jgi:sugar phosphate permease